jgi:phosphatidylglycerophosphate synthase
MSNAGLTAPPSRSRFWWAPNALTSLRLCAIPVLAAIIWTAPGPVTAIGGLLFGAIAITDFIDGKLVAVGLIGLLLLGRFFWLGPVAILARDAIAIASATILVRRGIPLEIDTPGKIASAVVMFGVGFGVGIDALWTDILFWTGVVLSVATFLNYARTVPKLMASAGT